MRTLVECNVMLFLVSVGILIFILRYRVHLHVEYNPKAGRSVRRRRAEREIIRAAVPQNAAEQLAQNATRRDLESALVNLGAGKEEARSRAAEAIAKGPGDFDALILRAMQAGTGNRRNPR